MEDSSRIRFLHYSSAGLPAEERHGQWSSRGWPSVASIFESVPIGEFSTTADTMVLGQVALSFAEGTARKLVRSNALIQTDGVTVLGVSAILSGEARGRAGSNDFHATAGDLLLVDLAQAVEMTISAGRTVQIAIPREMAEAQLGPVSVLNGKVVHKEQARMLVGHLTELAKTYRRLPAADGPRIARTLLDLLVLALHSAGWSAVRDGEMSGAAARARAEIRANLASPALTVASLCRRLRISRSTLHRLFEDEGGVQAFIRNCRLDVARAALLNPDNRERIREIAERLNFSDAAHFTRLFRARFGQTPGACRAEAGSVDEVVPSRDAPPAG